jgi:hypothetical protein
MGSPGKAGKRGRLLARIQKTIVCCGTHVKPWLRCPQCAKRVGRNRKAQRATGVF